MIFLIDVFGLRLPSWSQTEVAWDPFGKRPDLRMLSEMLGGGQACRQMEWIPFRSFPVKVISPMRMFPNLWTRPVKGGCSVTWRFSVKAKLSPGCGWGWFGCWKTSHLAVKTVTQLNHWVRRDTVPVKVTVVLETKGIWRTGNVTTALD